MKICFLSLLLLPAASGQLPSKMMSKNRAQPAVPGETLHDSIAPKEEVVTTSSAVFCGTCSPVEPFKFALTGGTGKGSIGVMNGDANVLDMTLDESAASSGQVKLFVENKEANFFGLDDGDDSHPGCPFKFLGVDSATASASCDAETDVLIITKDRASLETAELSASIEDEDGTAGVVQEAFEVRGNSKGRVKKMEAEVFENGLFGNSKRTRKLSNVHKTSASR